MKKTIEQMYYSYIFDNLDIRYYEMKFDEMIPLNTDELIKVLCQEIPYQLIKELKKQEKLKKLFRL